MTLTLAEEIKRYRLPTPVRVGVISPTSEGRGMGRAPRLGLGSGALLLSAVRPKGPRQRYHKKGRVGRETIAVSALSEAPFRLRVH